MKKLLLAFLLCFCIEGFAQSNPKRIVVGSTNQPGTYLSGVVISNGGFQVVSSIQLTNGATAGYFLQSDASGNATWTAAPGSITNIVNGIPWNTYSYLNGVLTAATNSTKFPLASNSDNNGTSITNVSWNNLINIPSGLAFTTSNNTFIGIQTMSSNLVLYPGLAANSAALVINTNNPTITAGFDLYLRQSSTRAIGIKTPTAALNVGNCLIGLDGTDIQTVGGAFSIIPASGKTVQLQNGAGAVSLGLPGTSGGAVTLGITSSGSTTLQSATNTIGSLGTPFRAIKTANLAVTGAVIVAGLYVDQIFQTTNVVVDGTQYSQASQMSFPNMIVNYYCTNNNFTVVREFNSGITNISTTNLTYNPFIFIP